MTYINVGMLGYSFMGKVHARALNALRQLAPDCPLVPRLHTICGRDADAVGGARRQLGFERAATAWTELVDDDGIEALDNTGPNSMHAEPTIAAARAGKHVVCEKPLAVAADQAFEMWDAAERAGVIHMTAFNYRFFPAIRLARQMIEEGELGELYHYRSSFLDASAVDPAKGKTAWRFQREHAGSGALGDLGAHHIDTARYLVGEPTHVMGAARTFVEARGGVAVDVDDAFEAVVEFDNGAIGTIEASRVAAGYVNESRIQVDGSRGSIAFDVQNLNRLRFGEFGKGFRDILVTERDHPFSPYWYPPGHPLGWDDSFTHELDHFFRAIAGEHSVTPHGASFEDGYRVAEICDAILRSAASGHREEISFRSITRSGHNRRVDR
ncbi:MAG: Gfo/Idh/MocA family protein [Solirubrobacteraceae bacterium]